MASETSTQVEITPTFGVQMQTQMQPEPSPVPLLEQRFAELKQSLVRPEHKQKVIESYDRLLKTLEYEAETIDRIGPKIVPEINFDDVLANGTSHICHIK